MLHIVYGDVLAEADWRDRLADGRACSGAAAGARPRGTVGDRGAATLQRLASTAGDVSRRLAETVARVRSLAAPAGALGGAERER